MNRSAGIVLGLLLLCSCGRSEGDRVRTARTLVAQWQLREAETVLRPLFERASAPADSTTLLYAEVLFARGELQRVRDLLDPLVARDAPFRLAALRYLAHTHFFLGHPDSSATLARALGASARQQDDTLRMAQAHHILGLVGFYRAAYDSALFHQEESLRLARRIHDLKAEADALRQIGVLYWYRGRLDKALVAYYEPALARYRQINDKIGEATTLSNIGLIRHRDEETNLRYQLLAFDIRKRIGDQIGLSDSYHFLGNHPYVRHPGGRTAGQTYTYLRKSLDISTRIGYAWGREVSLRSFELLRDSGFDHARREDLGRWVDSLQIISGEGRAHASLQKAIRTVRAERWQEAVDRFRQFYDVADSLDMPSFTYQALVRQVRPLRKLGRWEEAEQVLLEAQSLNGSDHRVDGALAELHMARQRPECAKHLLVPLTVRYDSLYLRTLFETEPGMAFERAAGAVHLMRADLYLTLIGALVQQHKPDDAFAHMERERSLPFWGEREQEESKTRQAVSRFVRLLEQYDTAPDRFEDVQTLLTAVGEMQQAMLAEQRLLSHTAPPSNALEIAPLAAMRQILGPQEVFVEYAMGRAGDVLYPVSEEEAIHVLVARRDTVALLSVAVSPDDVASIIDVYRHTVLRGRAMPRDTLWKASSYRLYSLLLAPIVERGLLQKGEHLIISPHRALHLVPFHALSVTPKTEKPRFVVEDHIVSYVPSATFLARARRHATTPFRSMLAVAPNGRSLPFSEREIRDIPEGLFPHQKTIRNGEARADLVLRELENYDAIHLAAHARMNPRFPLYSHIAFADRRLELHEMLRRKLQARLVVLSACETGRGIGAFGEVPSSEDLVSFPRALLTAGASSVVASLWLVEDAATASLMGAFYQNLQASCISASSLQPATQAAASSCGLAEALTLAQRRFLAETRATGEKAHPFYWAAFRLTGDGR
ncbi:MAG: CHAT domain-containing protein [Rhodothermales bacterium]